MKITDRYCVYWYQNNGFIDVFDTNLIHAKQVSLRANKKQNRVKTYFNSNTREGVILNIFSDVKVRGNIFI